MKNLVSPPKAHDGFSFVRRDTVPTRRQAVIFSCKTCVLRLVRFLREWGSRPGSLEVASIPDKAWVAFESRTSLYTAASRSEWALQAGKVQNLRVAARALNGRIARPGEIFSFWANVGRATPGRGFVAGRELREGCIIPNVGGGLCQLSNALYDVALQAGAEIIERHAHTRKVPGSSAAVGRDATVFWNYVDLRFRHKNGMRISAKLTAEELIVHLHTPAGVSANLEEAAGRESEAVPVESCETCGIADCFRHASASALPRPGGSGWIVDAFQPEHDVWMTSQRALQDQLLLPLQSKRLGVGPYRWNTTGFARVRQTPLTVLRRSLASRRLAAQGAARQRALLQMDGAMADALARFIPPLATHLTISQNLLPFLWREGLLGGRTFDVLMTRTPLHELEAQLDQAARCHPESRTLADFRAPPDLADNEATALAAADRWITPHSAIAALAGEKACLLEWQKPASSVVSRGKDVVFPASTLGRKGAYELRTVARELGFRVRLCGPVLEDPDFWRGVNVVRAEADWLTGAAAVVLPAWVEHQPRRLLRAVAAGVPVVASQACGLAHVPGVMSISTGDEKSLRNVLRRLLPN